MAGGFGTRLRPLTMSIPKPMVPIVNLPMMEHILNLLKVHHIKDIVSVLYFQPDSIMNYFGDGSYFGVKMQYVQAQADYGTAGCVKNSQDHLEERFIIISGDVLTDFDLTDAIKYHIEKKSQATILLTRHPTPLQYGIVMTDDDGKISRFLEKPSWGQVFSDTINTGIYILEKEVLDLIPYREEFDFSKDLFPKMLEKKLPLYGYIADGYWRDVGNLNEYQTGQNDAINGSLKVNYKGTKKQNAIVGTNVTLSPNAKINGIVLIGDNSTVDDYAELTDCVIGENVNIGKGARLTRTTLWNDITVEDFASMVDDVVCGGVVVGQAATINENVFISNGCRIGKEAILKANIKLWPNKIVEDGAILSTSLIQEEKWQRELFSDARISGVSNIEIQPEFCAKIGASFGLSIGKNKTIIVSRAPDNCSRIMKRAFCTGLTSVGVNVADIQIASIPQTRQELKTAKFEYGVHIRKSPRNSNLHDIILFGKDGKDITTDTAKKVERYFFGEDITRVNEYEMGTIILNATSAENYTQRYLSELDLDAIRSSKFKIVVDYSFGLSATVLPNLLGQMDTDVVSLNNYIDQRKYRPERQENLIDNKQQPDHMATIMKNLQYEIGFQIENGAEKISIIDKRGIWLSHHRLLCIVTWLFLETNKHKEPYKIAISILAGKEIEQIASKYNVQVVRIKNSHSAMMEVVSADDEILFVGGSYGGFVFKEHLHAADGMFTIGKILEMLAKTKQNIADIDEQLPRRYQVNKTIAVPWEKKGQVMRKAMEHSDGFERTLVEGIKIFKDDDSILIYPEKESPHFTIIADAGELHNADKLTNQFVTLINKWKENEGGI